MSHRFGYALQLTVCAFVLLLTASSANAVVLIIFPQTASVTPLGTRQFDASVQGIQNFSVSWSVDGIPGGNASVGTIDLSGRYLAPNSTGTHVISATGIGIPTYSVNATANVITAPPGVTPLLTYHNDLARDGANSQETTLKPSNVNTRQFGKLMSLAVDGQIYAQPLYVPNLTINGVQHNVVFVATENDTVYAFDGDGLSDSPLWSNHLATPLQNNDQKGIDPLLGITSTPVIDSTAGILYVLTDGLEHGNKVYRLHALGIATGAEMLGGPVIVTGKVPGTGWNSENGIITLEDSCYQRESLALDPSSSAVYIGFSHCHHGWILAYNKSTLQQTAIFNDTADGAGGSFWDGGGAPAIDNSGDLYLIGGTDFNDPAAGYNNSILRLAPGDLSVVDYFKPSNDAWLRTNDADLGSGAAIIMPDNSSATPHELIGGGKDGRIFVVDRDNMGQFQMTDHVIQEVQTGRTQFDNIYSTPTFWNGYLYYHCANDFVRAFSWNSTTGLISDSPISIGTKYYGVHGATASLSANGSSDAVLWEIESSNVLTGGPAVLHAYNALDVSKQLYSSSLLGARDMAGPAVKFVVPSVVDGHVYVGTGSELDIYGLF